jgi:hypothetical protein
MMTVEWGLEEFGGVWRGLERFGGVWRGRGVAERV